MRLASLTVVILFGVGSLGADEAPLSTGSVVLPAGEYRGLREKAYPAEPEPAPPPVAATLSRLDYALRVQGDGAQGEARLVIDVLKDGWAPVVIPPGLRVESARLDGRPVALVGATGGAARVVLTHPGRATLVLTIAVPVTQNAGTESLSLPSGAPVTHATVTVPQDGLDVQLSGALLRETTNRKGETSFSVDGSGGPVLSLSWKRRVEDRRAGLPLRIRGVLTEFVGLGEDVAQVSAEVHVDVVHGLARAISLDVPEGVVINEVTGANVADWDPKGSVLHVTFLEPVESSENVVVTGEAHCPREGHLTIPLLRLRDAERETGGVAVEVVGAGEVTNRETSGLDATDPKELGSAIASHDSPLLVAFRLRPQGAHSPRCLAVTVARYTPQAVLMAMAEEARYDTLLTDDGKVLVRARYAVRNNQQSFLVVKLPLTATLWSASVGNRPARPGRGEDGSYLLPLEKGKAGEEVPAFPVELVYLDRGAGWAREGRVRLTLPQIDLPVSRTGLLLYRSPHYQLKPDPGAFREEGYRDPLSPAFKADRQEVPQGVPADAGIGAAMQGLVDRFALSMGRMSSVLPIEVPFPRFGDILFMGSELTKEGEAPFVDLHYRKTKGGHS